MRKQGKYIYEWPRPMVTVDALVFELSGKVPRVLLVKRANEPFKGQWAIPGGFVDIDEELDDAAARELKEETGLRGVKLEQMYTFGGIGRDPRGRQITICYLGIIENDNTAVKGGDDASEARWWPINSLPEPLAFDHSKVIAMGVARLAARNA